MTRALLSLSLCAALAAIARAEVATETTPRTETTSATPAEPRPYEIFVARDSPMSGRLFVNVGPGYSAINSHQKVTHDGTSMRDERRHTSFAGAEVSMGYAFGATDFGHHEVYAGTGVIIRQQHLRISIPGAYVKTDEIDTIIPITFGYRYQLAVGKTTSVHLGAFGGPSIVGYGIDANGYGLAETDSDFDVTWQVGVGVGVRHWFTRRFGVDIGYDFRVMGNTRHDLTIFNEQYRSRYTDMRAHTIRLGFLFAF